MLCYAQATLTITIDFNRCKRLKYCSPTTPCIIEQFGKADQPHFETVLTDHHHVLYRLLPPNKTHQYTLSP